MLSRQISRKKNERDNIPLNKKMEHLKFRNFYRRRLPHFQVEGAAYFVTFRLINSLPGDILESLAQESKRIRNLSPEKSDQEQRRWFGRFDSYLDNCTQSETFLRDPSTADMIVQAIRFRDSREYDLSCLCIMPNHVHLVFSPKEKSPDVYYGLGEILHSLKGYTARQANKILGRNGPFWQSESYDRVVRDQGEFERILRYALYNPVKAGLTDDWKKWQWSFCKYEM